MHLSVAFTSLPDTKDSTFLPGPNVSRRKTKEWLVDVPSIQDGSDCPEPQWLQSGLRARSEDRPWHPIARRDGRDISTALASVMTRDGLDISALLQTGQRSGHWVPGQRGAGRTLAAPGDGGPRV